MKIAVIFILSLSLTNAISTNAGNQIKLKDLDKEKCEIYVRLIQGLLEKREMLQNCPESEKQTIVKCLAEELIRIVKLLAIDLNCPLKSLLSLLEIPNSAIELILNGNIEALLQIIQIEPLLRTIISLLEGLFAKLGLVLKQQLAIVTSLLESTLKLDSCDFLHDTLEQVVRFLSGTVMGNLLNIGTDLLKVVGNLLGGNLLGGNLLGGNLLGGNLLGGNLLKAIPLVGGLPL